MTYEYGSGFLTMHLKQHNSNKNTFLIDKAFQRQKYSITGEIKTQTQ